MDHACDADDGAIDGLTRFGKLRGGDYTVIQRTTISGYEKAEPAPLVLGVMETSEFSVLIPQPAPKITKGPWIISLTQTSAVIYWETDQKVTSTVDYGLTTNLGRQRPTTQPPPSMTHQVELSPLNPGTIYHYRVVSGNVNGDVASSTVSFRTPAATATARLSVTKTNSDRSVLLPGACFDVYTDAGGGALGRYVETQCDQYDAAPNNGKVLFPALAPGSYVLVESRSPEGYALSAKRTFSVTAGQTYRTTVTNSRGGALLTIKARTDAGKLLRGVCYNVWKMANGDIGEFVAAGCDDYDGENGYTPIGNFRAGTYWVEAFDVPAGFVLPVGTQLTITSGQRTATLTFTSYAETAGDNVEIQAVDGNGKLLPGACFQLFLGNTARSACDWWDGLNDGRTFFTNVGPDTYTALEYHAPPGYKTGKRTTFTKADNTFKRLRFTQSPGGVRVTVKTLKGNTSAVLPGACYVLYKQVSSGLWPNVGSWCDSYDGATDGITRLDGVPAGTYALVQWNTPSGYAAPANKIIVVGSTGLSVTVGTYAGTSAAGQPGMSPPPFIDPPVIVAYAATESP